MSHIGVQLYTVRDKTQADFEGALKAVAEIGYQGVEFAGYGGLEAEHLRDVLEELGLKSAGSHVGYQRLVDALDEEIDYCLTLGSRYLVCPYLGEEQRKDLAAWQEVYNKFAYVGRRCSEKGISFCYHNHAFEFTQQLGGINAFDKLYQSVPADVLQIEMDTCWVHKAQYDPVEYLNKYEGRVPLIHLKDMRRLEEGATLTVELGQGEVDLLAIASTASATGAEWIIVEQDSCQNDSLVSIRNSMQWIKDNSLLLRS
jgi:sugar phosphate isomerase/epimerase